MEKKSLEELKVMDCFSLFEINPNATDEEIRKAHRKVSILYHPDTNEDDSALEKMQVINQAFEKIKTQEKREEYKNGLYNQEKENYKQYQQKHKKQKQQRQEQTQHNTSSHQQSSTDPQKAIAPLDQTDIEEESFNHFLDAQSTDFKRMYYSYYYDLMSIAKEVNTNGMDQKRVDQQTRKLALQYTQERIGNNKNASTGRSI